MVSSIHQKLHVYVSSPSRHRTLDNNIIARRLSTNDSISTYRLHLLPIAIRERERCEKKQFSCVPHVMKYDSFLYDYVERRKRNCQRYIICLFQVHTDLPSLGRGTA